MGASFASLVGEFYITRLSYAQRARGSGPGEMDLIR